MNKILGFVAAGLLAATLTAASTIPAQAGKLCGKISCAQPTGVAHGQKAPVWTVVRCVIGQPGSWMTVDCKSASALNYASGRRPYVCFIATDKKVHEDDQSVVHIGRPFINRNIGGRWQPDWQS